MSLFAYPTVFKVICDTCPKKDGVNPVTVFVQPLDRKCPKCGNFLRILPD